MEAIVQQAHATQHVKDFPPLAVPGRLALAGILARSFLAYVRDTFFRLFSFTSMLSAGSATYRGSV